jgi:hypothetical protein
LTGIFNPLKGKLLMKNARISAIALALSALVAGQALAADPAAAKTREQVRAEYLQAQRNGDLIVDIESGQTARQLNPSLYAADVIAQGKTRAEVRAELAEAQRNGDVIADIEVGLTAREINPALYPAEVTAQGKTRAEVREELAQARRNGSYDPYLLSVN